MAYIRVQDRVKTKNPFDVEDFSFPDVKKESSINLGLKPVIPQQNQSYIPVKRRPTLNFKLGDNLPKTVKVKPFAFKESAEQQTQARIFGQTPTTTLEQTSPAPIGKTALGGYIPVSERSSTKIKTPFAQSEYSLSKTYFPEGGLAEGVIKYFAELPEKVSKSLSPKYVEEIFRTGSVPQREDLIRVNTYQEDLQESIDNGMAPWTAFVLNGVSAAIDISIVGDALKPLVSAISKVPVTKAMVEKLTWDDLVALTRGEEFAGKISLEKLAAFDKAKQMYGKNLNKLIKKNGAKLEVQIQKGKTLGQWMKEQQPGFSIKDVTKKSATEGIEGYVFYNNRKGMTSAVVKSIDALVIKPTKTTTLYREGVVDSNDFQSWSKNPKIGDKVTKREFTPDEMLIDLTNPRASELFSDIGKGSLEKFKNLENEVIVKGVTPSTIEGQITKAKAEGKSFEEFVNKNIDSYAKSTKEYKDWAKGSDKIIEAYHGSPYSFDKFEIGKKQAGVYELDGISFASKKNLAEPFSRQYPDSYYVKKKVIDKKYPNIDEIKNKIQRVESNSKIRSVKSVEKEGKELQASLKKEWEKDKGWLYNNDFEKFKTRDVNQYSFNRLKELENELKRAKNKTDINITAKEKKALDEYNKELQKLEDTIEGNVYKVYIKGKKIQEEIGEEIGFSSIRNEIVNELDGDILRIKDADTGQYIGEEIIVNNPKQIFIVNSPKTKSQLKQLWDKQEALGVAGGVQEDEDGNIKFSPTGALLGVGASKIVKVGKGTKVPSSVYKQNRVIKRSLKAIIKLDTRAIIDNIKLGSDKYLGSISTRLKNINPELKRGLRTFEYNIRKTTLDDTKEIKPFLEATKKMSKEDYLDFDLARKNGDSEKIQELIIKYKIGKEYSATRKTLNNLYKRAEDAGYDIGYREHYHPRVIKDKVGFINHFRGGENWSAIDQAIKAKENALQMALTEDQKVQLINTMIRGYAQNSITLSEIGNMKAREINLVDAELNQFYQDANASLVNYINKSNEAIEAKRFFGKGRFNEEVDINDSIGAYVLDLMAKGKITPNQEILVSDMLKARFNAVSTRGAISVYKNLSYIDTMGSPTSAITQIGDLSWSLYKAGVIKTTKSFARAIVGKSKIKREDIGIENIAAEFDDPTKSAKAVNKVFKLVGLEKIDAIGKETLINSVITKYQTWAEKGNKKLEQALETVFGKDTAEIIADLKSGEITENVKLLAFNELLDMQPVALSEMPQKYLTGGNGRLFYMLKTFTLKQFDIYRNEIFQQLGNKGTRMQGLRNMIKLLSSFVIMNATADEIKDFMLGRKTSLKDRTVDNILRAVGFSKYLTWKVRTEGLGSGLVRQILPPFKFIDSVSKDILKGIENGSEVIQSIPVGGKLYYWWFGKGATKNKKRIKANTKTRLDDFEDRIEKVNSNTKLKEFEDRIKKIQSK